MALCKAIRIQKKLLLSHTTNSTLFSLLTGHTHTHSDPEDFSFFLFLLLITQSHVFVSPLCHLAGSKIMEMKLIFTGASQIEQQNKKSVLQSIQICLITNTCHISGRKLPLFSLKRWAAEKVLLCRGGSTENRESSWKWVWNEHCCQCL